MKENSLGLPADHIDRKCPKCGEITDHMDFFGNEYTKCNDCGYVHFKREDE